MGTMATDPEMVSPIHYYTYELYLLCASQIESADLIRDVRICIDNGAHMVFELEEKDRGYETIVILREACANPKMPLVVIRILVQCGADVDRYDNKASPLILVCRRDRRSGSSASKRVRLTKSSFRIIQYLVSKGADVNYCSPRHNSALESVIETSPSAIWAIRYLIRYGAKVSNYVLHIACRHGSPLNVIALLIKHGADVNGSWYGDGTSLQVLCSSSHTEHTLKKIKYLVSKGANVHDATNRASINVACAYGNDFTPSIMKYLIAKGFDVNQKDAHGYTVLQYVCMNAHIHQELFRILLKHTREVPNDCMTFLTVPACVDAYCEWMEKKMFAAYDSYKFISKVSLPCRFVPDLLDTIYEYLTVVSME